MVTLVGFAANGARVGPCGHETLTINTVVEVVEILECWIQSRKWNVKLEAERKACRLSSVFQLGEFEKC